jgi:hypothetical protein
LSGERELFAPEERTIYAPQIPPGLINVRQWVPNHKKTTNRYLYWTES